METSKKHYLKQSNGSQKGTRLSVGRTVLSTAFGKKLEDRLALVRGAVTPLQSHEQWKKKRHKKENPEHKRKLCGKVCDRDGEVGGGVILREGAGHHVGFLFLALVRGITCSIFLGSTKNFWIPSTVRFRRKWSSLGGTFFCYGQLACDHHSAPRTVTPNQQVAS